MGFTTPCFIRKSTPELRKKLEELGYRLFGAELNEDLCIFTGPEYSLYSVEFFSNIPHPDETDSVDCGTNEELFLAIAAFLNDSIVIIRTHKKGVGNYETKIINLKRQ